MEEKKETEVLDKEETETIPEEEKKEESTPEVVEEQPKEPTPETPKKKSKAGLVICVILLALLVVLALLFVPSLLGKKNNEKGHAGVDNQTKASPYRIKGNSLDDFDLYFLQLENNEKNNIYSPLSIKYALAMLNEGTDGLTHEQIANIIGDYKAKKYNNNEHMSFANSMFIRNTFKETIKEDYTKKLQDKFGAEVFTEDFSSADPMNNWVSNKTFKLINNLLDNDTVNGLDYILINALAIDMNWTSRLQVSYAKLPEGMKQFKYNVNYQHENYGAGIGYIEEHEHIEPADKKWKFNNVEGTEYAIIGASFNKYDIIKELGEENIRKTVTDKYNEFLNSENGSPCADTVEEYIDQYMEELGSNYKRADISTEFSLYTDDDVKVFAKDLQTYDGTTLQYVAIMPKNITLKEYIKDVNAEKVSTLIGKVKEVKYENFKEGVITKVTGNIPLFKNEFEMNLIEELKELGVTDVFTEKADMSKMLTTEGHITFAKHKAMIEFSNDGIKAAAVSAVGGMGSTGICGFKYDFDVPVEEIDITFDKPFMYVIRDKSTGEVWFTGAVYNPLA